MLNAMNKNKEVNRCTCCNKKLNSTNIVWYNLSTTDGTYYSEGIPAGHDDQGWFPFGIKCANSLSK